MCMHVSLFREMLKCCAMRSLCRWQALDGTPKGLGAASVQAVYDLNDEYPLDTKTLISSVCEKMMLGKGGKLR